MLSAQCDELRWLADNLEEHDIHMDEYVQAMRSAVVTIWELRNKMCDMVDEREEAERLMAERDEWHRVAVSKQDIIDHMRDARAENAKLRELADAVKEFVEDTNCEDCPFRRDCDDNNRIFCASDFSYHAFAAMRELGVEV